VRVLRYCLSVPDRFYHGPTARDDRWLLRCAMVGRLPDVVRLNRRRGVQAADLPARLQAEGDAVDALFAGMAQSHAAACLDFRRLQNVWQEVQTISPAMVQNSAAVILLRGVAAGLFLARETDLRTPAFRPEPAGMRQQAQTVLPSI